MKNGRKTRLSAAMYGLKIHALLYSACVAAHGPHASLLSTRETPEVRKVARTAPEPEPEATS